MRYTKADVDDMLAQWESYFSGVKLPLWAELPNIELYMDQVVVLLNEYLSGFYGNMGEDKPITPAMINNYVKQKLIPPPIKKKYGKAHLALLVMICLLKQPLGIAQVARLLPAGEEDEIRRGYDGFAVAHGALCGECVPGVRTIADMFFEFENDKTIDSTKLALSAAITAGYAKLLCEKLIGEPESEEKPKQSKK